MIIGQDGGDDLLNVIPRFIAAMAREGRARGSFSGSSVFVDVSGFTSMTERLMAHGKKGAEVLSGIINSVFAPAVSRIRQSGGFISSFGGDSFMVLLPGGTTQTAKALAAALCGAMGARSSHATELGEFEIAVRTGVSEGQVEWGILGSRGRRCYYFRGDPVAECARSAVAAPVSASHLPDATRPPGSKPDRAGEVRVSRSIARLFAPEVVLSSPPGGEFRDVLPVFISFEEPGGHEDLARFADIVLGAAESFGGCVTGLYFEEKGPLFLVLFGAPSSYEHQVSRAAGFALAVRDGSSTGCRMAITQGVAFAGFVGNRGRCSYTALGDTVNTAARIACQAEWGSVLVSGSAAGALESGFELSAGPRLRLRGKRSPVPTMKLERRLAGGRAVLFDTGMVGRKRELRQLRAAIRGILDDGSSGGVRYVYGEAGAGKSLLVDRALEPFRDRCLIALMECDDILRKSLNPFTAFLRGLFGQAPDQSREDAIRAFDAGLEAIVARLRGLEDQDGRRAAEELERLRSVLGALIGLSWPGSLYESLGARTRFENTLLALKELVRGLSLLQPVVIVLEDLQWADSDTLKALRALTRNVERLPLLVIATARILDDGSRPALELDEGIRRESLLLGDLRAEAALELESEVLGGPPDSGLAGLIEERCGGNPFYIRQFCLHLREGGLIGLRDWQAALTGPAEGVPTGVKALLIARLDRLSARLRDLVQTASVLGREFNIRVLSLMLRGRDVRPMVESVDLLSIWAPLSEMLFIFRHDLMREAAYDMQLGRRVRRLHRLAAEALEDLFADEPGMLADIAFHFDRAGVAGKARRYLVLAADHAESAYRNDHALELLGKLRDHYAEGSRRRNELACRMLGLLQRTGDWKRAEKLARDTLESSGMRGQRALEVRCLIRLGSLLTSMGQTAEARQLLTTAATEAGRLRDQVRKAEALIELSTLTVNEGDYEGGMRVLRKAKKAAERAGDRSLIGSSLNSIGRVHTFRGEYDQALEALQQYAAMAEESGDLKAMCTAGYNIGVINYYTGLREKGLKAFETALETARKIGDRRTMGLAIGSIGSVLAERGDRDRALDCQREKLRIAREMDDKVAMLFALGNIGLSHFYGEEYEEALEYYGEYMEIARATGSRVEICRMLGSIGNVYGKLLDYEKAERNYEEMLKLAEELGDASQWLAALRFCGWIRMERGRVEESRELLEKGLRHAREIRSTTDVLYFLGSLASLETFLGNHEAVVGLLSEGLAIAREVGDGPELVDKLAGLASASLELGRAGEAEAYATEALEASRETPCESAEWSSRLVLVRLRARKDRAGALKALEAMIEQSDHPERTAELVTARFELSGKEPHRRGALEALEALYEKTGSVRYPKEIARLKRRT
ncbi:AAA family ATPase [Candidatus Fermentibacterales bacterium]|nr:AAA family ATPase [Candidatus Fermentibacterales bacterium]